MQPTQQQTHSSADVPIQQAGKGTMECGAAIGRGEMQQFVEAFQQSARRWEFIVYPALFAFIVLAGYGFFLVYSLTSNMSLIAKSIDPNMYVHMESMTQSISGLRDDIGEMTVTMRDISVKLDNLSPMQANTESMDASIRQLEHSIRVITTSTDQMRQDMGSMNRNIARPMGMFNYMPW